MKIIIILTAVFTVIEAFRLTILCMRSSTSLFRKILEAIILIVMVIICYFNLECINKSLAILSIIFNLYVLISFIYELVIKEKHISILSVKNGIDMISLGIMFLDEDESVILINNKMSDILKCLNIKKDYVKNLIKSSFRKLNENHLLRCNNEVYQLKIINNKEITLLDITELYNLREIEERQNKEILKNNKRMKDAIDNIEELLKVNNLLKIKNEYHDILGHRLALFNKYLEQNKKDVSDISFLLNSIYNDFNENSVENRLNELVKMYKIVGINIDINGVMPSDVEVSNILFEIIREGVTNAIIHADSKYIKIVIMSYLDKIEMTIANSLSAPSGVIRESEGIKGMRRKLMSVGGSLSIRSDNEFELKVVIEKGNLN